MPLSLGLFLGEVLKSGHKYAGVLVCTHLKKLLFSIFTAYFLKVRASGS